MLWLMQRLALGLQWRFYNVITFSDPMIYDLRKLLQSKVSQQLFIHVLSCEASVCQVAVDVAPFMQTSVVEHLQFIGDDEGHDMIGQALLKHQQATYSAIAILEGMDALKTNMEIQNIFQRLLAFTIIPAQ